MKALYLRFTLLLEKAYDLAPLLARLTLGGVFVESGWGKLHSLDKVIGYFTELGIPAPHLQAPFVAGVEFFCGAAVLIGLFTRLASLPLIGTMVVAIITAKKDSISELTDIFAISEYLYIVLLFWLVVAGPGRISVDRLVFKKS